MTLNELQLLLEQNPSLMPRFILPDRDHIPPHAHVTEVGHVVRNFIDCGGLTGREDSIVLQTHVGNDIEHRLRCDRLAKILSLGQRVIPNPALPVAVEYDCCVVSQYPILKTRITDDHFDIILERKGTQCRARERQKLDGDACCATKAPCCQA